MTETEYRDRYRWLCRALAGRYPGADPDLIHDAVTDALLDHWRRPERFDSTRATEFGYLRMAATRNLMNLLERRRVVYALTERDATVEIEDVIMRAEMARECRAWLLAQARDEIERAVVRWWLAGGWRQPGQHSYGREAWYRACERLTKRLRRQYRQEGRLSW